MSNFDGIRAGLEAALRLRDIDIAREKVARYRAERELAGWRLEIAKLDLHLAQRASRTGKDQMPLNAEAAQRFFGEQEAADDER